MRAYLASKWRQFTQWAAWSAWNHARTREVARGKWKPDAPTPHDPNMTPEQRRRLADEARQVLDNRHFNDAWNAVHAALEGQALHCDPDNAEKARRVVISMQLLTAVRRELVRKVDDGYMAEVQINELESQRKKRAFVR